MKPPAPRSEEIELKLALPGADPSNPSALLKRLARTPVLARRKPVKLSLRNIYYDTPGQFLHQERIALRLRRIGSESEPAWLQTLKIAGRSDSALSRRGEWEAPVADAGLSRPALDATPWPALDPDGRVFEALTPCFETNFERTSWTVRKRDGSVVEVSLDMGEVVAGGQRTPLCELELELLAGEPSALFAIAGQIAAAVAVLPLASSKAERGYALLRGALNQPVQARPPALKASLPPVLAAQRVLREMLDQFTRNLHTLRSTDDPEVVHQARVGWRRFKSALRLFRPALVASSAPPSWDALQPLLIFLGELRDLDVARTATLPPLADAYAAGDAKRKKKWQAMTQAFDQAARLQHTAVRYALETPAVGLALLATTQWLETLPAPNPTGEADPVPKTALRHWARRRIVRQYKQLKKQLKAAACGDASASSQHRVRILSKRLRYGIEALRPLLSKRMRRRWYARAQELQTRLGTARDLVQATTLASRLETDAGLAEFLRGVALGRGAPPA
ncbi:MAG: CYTH and CHAD domain-containing protein [Polaromonas sp.]